MKKILPALAIILFAVILRVLPHIPNMAPITAMALFGGVYLSKKYALIIPLIAMFFSDIFLGFHDTMAFVYGSFILTGCIGIWLRDRKSSKNIIAGTLFASLLFFVITNFGVWLVSKMYPHTLTGLLDAYLLGLPFFRNTIVGDLVYIGIFFSAYEVVARYVMSIEKSKVKIKNLKAQVRN